MNPQKKIIGRQHELMELHRLFEKVENGRGGIVLIPGEAGMGKTLLAEESLAESSLRVFTGRATEDATPPYSPIASAVRDYLRQSPDGRIDIGSLAPYLSLLLPELQVPTDGVAQHPQSSQEADMPGEVDRETLIETIGTALQVMTQEGPAAIFLDDLQWADDATLEILPALTERMQVDPLLILATYRNDEVPRGHRLRWLRNELRRRRYLQEIPVEALSRHESLQLMKRILEDRPAPELEKLIYEQTQGVPLFVEELSSALVAQELLRKGDSGLELSPGKDVPIPESIRDAVLLRLDTLSEEARNQLQVASIAGMEFDLELVTKLAGEETGLDELFSRSLIVEVEAGRAAFRHALTREAVRSEIMWSRRRSLNRSIAGYLEERGASPELIAEHWLAANELNRARQALINSARRSCDLHAYGDAARAAHRALEIWPEREEEDKRLQTLEKLAHCAQVSGQLSDAVRALREVVESPLLKKDRRRCGEAQRALATVYGLQGSWEQSLAARKASAEAFETAGLPAEAASEWLAAAARHTGMMRYSAAVELCDRAFELARRAERRDLEARIMGLKGNLLSVLGKPQQGIEMVNAGLSLALKYNLTEAASEVYRRLGSTLEYASEYTSSREAYYTAYNYCQNQGADMQARVCLGCMSYVLFRTGDWKQAIDICREVLNDEKTPFGSRALANCVIGLIRSYRGEARPARKHLQEAMSVSRHEENKIGEMLCLWGLAQVEEYDEKNSAAEEYYRQLLSLWETTPDLHDALPALCSAATFFSTHRLPKECALCTRTLASIATQSGNHETLAGLAHALGETALLNGNAREAARQFLQALIHFEKMEVPMERIKTEFRTGMAFLQEGEKETAVRHLTNAYRLARNIGARPLAARLAKELGTLGEPAEESRRPEGTERINRAGLTRRQLEIARLIASGLTNKEIANKLFISPRTVEMHVANMLDRLDCRSRSEAVHKAGELGLLD